MDHFYILEPEEASENGARWSTAIPMDPVRLGEKQKCPICGQPVSENRWLSPHHVHLSSAKSSKWGDFLWVSKTALLVSEKFKQIYAQEGLSGISSFSPPVVIDRFGVLKKGQFPPVAPVYHLIHILWGGANQDDAASGFIQQHPAAIRCHYCRSGHSGRSQSRVAIQAGSWNGQDVFAARNAPVPFLVSERFKHVVEAHNLTNAWFIPAEQYAYDENRWGQWFINANPSPDRAVEALPAA